LIFFLLYSFHKYLIFHLDTNDSFSQNLFSRQDEIDKIWLDLINNKLKLNTEKTKNIKNKIKIYSYHTTRILTFANIRFIFNIHPFKKHHLNVLKLDTEERAAELEEIIVKSDRTVKEWGGKLYIVYQPQKENFIDGDPNYLFDLALKISKKNNIPIIDMNEKVFSVHPDPLSLLPFRKDPHVNVKANKLMAEVIANRVIRDGVLDPR